ncbi:hypothetical protein CTAYLR_006301 [Chrysophaeum taylorii]|uniref:Uncharacterized protein n=1 Tax=Chrysophaeum taylorii TaxID=2483200 RepID=A0AAD7UJX5_9STRA|nr:hypothetical protein CTAYLR_006301 [Chrysophaeum taylorii]
MRNAFEKRSWKVENPACDRYIYSRKYDSACMPSPYELLPLLVTGTGGIGTRVVTELLRAMGVEAGHEKYDAHATVSWTHAVNDFAFGVPYPFSSERTLWWQNRKIRNRVDFENVFKPRWNHVVHLTRCPIKVIKSMLRPHAPVLRFVERATHSPSLTSPCASTYDCETDLKERVGWATSMYVAWNEHVERYADERLRIEDFGRSVEKTAKISRKLCDLSFALKRKTKTFHSCAARVDDIANSTIPLLLSSSRDDRGSRQAGLALEHLREARFAPGVDGPETIDEYLKMARRYGYAGECVVGNDKDERRLYWCSRKHEVQTDPPRVETLTEDSQTKGGIERCMTTKTEDCSLVETRCPTSPPPRDCLRARVLFRTPYRRLKCCFRCCLLYWLRATNFASNMRYHVEHAKETFMNIGFRALNPDAGDFGLDPELNLLVHPHAFAAISDVHMHPARGCHLTSSSSTNRSTTIASLYHHKPDVTLLPFGVKAARRKDPWMKDKEFKACVARMRNSKKLIFDVFDPSKQLPGVHLAKRLSLFMANNVGLEPPLNTSSPPVYRTNKIRERPIGVRGISLWQAILEHPNLDSVPQRTDLLLCCCMNVDGMHKGRMEHTKVLARHPAFNCPLDEKYRGHHIGFPRNDPGVHEIEAEFVLMLNDKYGNRKNMNGNYDAHMPVLMLGSKFVYSPNGVGEQCYREYEALVSGAIPVLDDSTYARRHAALSELPTVRVENASWETITPEFLEKKWEEMSRRDFDVSVLYLPHWYDLILAAAGII